ncbi:hypothetical protein Tco_1334872 [Tanacetum coccineum]
MIDCLSNVETDKLFYTVKTDIVKLVVEIESFGMSSDESDKETESFDGLQPKQADLCCVHALNELHLHKIHVVPIELTKDFIKTSSSLKSLKRGLLTSPYFIWQERNWRLFKGTKRSVQQVTDCIVSAVRLKLLTCRFKRSKDGSRYARLWDLSDSIFR